MYDVSRIYPSLSSKTYLRGWNEGAQRLRNDDEDMDVEEAPGRDGAASHAGSSAGKVEGVVTVSQWDPWRTADIVRGEKDALTIRQRSCHHTQFDRRTIHRTGKAASHVAECYLKMNGGDDGTHIAEDR
ncbi:hypothetical protein M422DRAFT_269889 [Sphaerobolus stellatus SS14]|uniref:Unplaced genomic scaffold SPHSTscaffold_223, whole genome shotgun sequence n=1 Tax=Sphaerobolus stellatus (strain SS14) TaxID=990650 RepID=A0A0C9UIL7_SPHS4|nr:hypothetical protein M422DRAFT_269889 [Sphaerobolus stellatus SS14]